MSARGFLPFHHQGDVPCALLSPPNPPDIFIVQQIPANKNNNWLWTENVLSKRNEINSSVCLVAALPTCCQISTSGRCIQPKTGNLFALKLIYAHEHSRSAAISSYCRLLVVLTWQSASGSQCNVFDFRVLDFSTRCRDRPVPVSPLLRQATGTQRHKKCP